MDNEQLLKEVQDVASDNLKVLKRIYNLENYYETVLLPKMFSFPKQYIEKVKLQKAQQKALEKKIKAQIKLSQNF